MLPSYIKTLASVKSWTDLVGDGREVSITYKSLGKGSTPEDFHPPHVVRWLFVGALFSFINKTKLFQ